MRPHQVSKSPVMHQSNKKLTREDIAVLPTPACGARAALQQRVNEDARMHPADGRIDTCIHQFSTTTDATVRATGGSRAGFTCITNTCAGFECERYRSESAGLEP